MPDPNSPDNPPAAESSPDRRLESAPAHPVEAGTWRILDASLNRASEGLRVVEDFARMILNDGYLTGMLKTLRHDLTVAARNLDQKQLIAHRDTDNDVGTGIATSAEYQREEPVQVVQANLSRLQQSLRTIEEYTKSFAGDVSRAVEQLRYRSYSLEKALVTLMLSHQTLRDAKLCVLIDGGSNESEFRRLSEGLIEGGADLLQLRDKQLDARNLISRGLLLTAACQGTRARWIMNDRSDLALAAGAHGVHLGQGDLPVAAARRILGPARIIGVSTHSLAQARAAVIEGANYIGVGPVFFSQTKSFREVVGLDLVREVAGEVSLPAFAIGGIDETNVNAVLTAGARRIAVSGAVSRAADPVAAVRRLASLLQNANSVRNANP